MHKPADLLFRNGAVYTVDAQRSRAQAVGVSGQRIIFVGSDEAAAKHIGPDTEIVDLKGKMLLPGFIDSHAHASAAFDEKRP